MSGFPAAWSGEGAGTVWFYTRAITRPRLNLESSRAIDELFSNPKFLLERAGRLLPSFPFFHGVPSFLPASVLVHLRLVFFETVQHSSEGIDFFVTLLSELPPGNLLGLVVNGIVPLRELLDVLFDVVLALG